MRKFPGVHEYFRHLFLTEHQARDANTTIGVTHLDGPFPLFCDEFLSRTAIRIAYMNIKSKDSGGLFYAKGI